MAWMGTIYPMEHTGDAVSQVVLDIESGSSLRNNLESLSPPSIWKNTELRELSENEELLSFHRRTIAAEGTDRTINYFELMKIKKQEIRSHWKLPELLPENGPNCSEREEQAFRWVKATLIASQW
ncbi:hypothetical protein CEXT_215881 [Caerostris extrusa]|uniref:Uncharacterized protein n=1 Tax=Caerostris extrusa TaxID=172846 RepID=A0AAV4QHI2_CAEEX|nr:hypothetical protein CEXT_215881 [Caerostris extrusa]